MLILELDTSGESCRAPGVVYDVEAGFATTRIVDKDTSAKLLKAIDKSQFTPDFMAVIDGFGYKISIADISTGAMAALVVANNPDKTVALIEAGENAIEAIVKFCRNGHVIINREVTLEFDKNSECDVWYNGKRCLSTDEFEAHWTGDDVYEL